MMPMPSLSCGRNGGESGATDGIQPCSQGTCPYRLCHVARHICCICQSLGAGIRPSPESARSSRLGWWYYGSTGVRRLEPGGPRWCMVMNEHMTAGGLEGIQVDVSPTGTPKAPQPRDMREMQSTRSRELAKPYLSEDFEKASTEPRAAPRYSSWGDGGDGPHDRSRVRCFGGRKTQSRFGFFKPMPSAKTSTWHAK